MGTKNKLASLAFLQRKPYIDARVPALLNRCVTGECHYRVLSHRLCEIGCKDTKLSANNLLSPREINKSSRKRAGKAVSSFCGRFDLWSSLLTLGRVDASITLLSLNRSLKEFLFNALL